MAINEPIAIVGMAGIFPGAANLQEFWANIVNARDCTGPIPRGRWPLNSSELFDPRVANPDTVYSTRGGFVGDFPWNPSSLKLDPELLDTLDPLHRLALYAARHAWGSAQTAALDHGRVGVILGHIVLPTETSTEFSRQILAAEFEAAQGLPESTRERSPVAPINVFPAGLPAKLVARALGLNGRAFTLDAACASSFYALALAVAELKSGRADAMIAGGLSRPDPLFTQMGFSQLRALSARGKPAPFDAHGDGLVVGEGSGMFVLKRLSDAVAQGDRIHGLIAGIGLSNDVRGDLLAPSSEGQLRAMRGAYAQAGWSPQDVDLIECHATGTPLGDAVEVQSLKTLWESVPHREAAQKCVIGSAKSNYGHALTAAGSVGLLKVLLALREGILPPTANFERPAPKLDLEGSPFRVLGRPETWNRRDDGQPRRAALSAFGFGGINAHVLIEEYIPRSREQSKAVRSVDAPIVIVGMAAHFGSSTNLREFQSRVLNGDRPGSAATDETIADFPVRLDQFRIPPIELEAILPQQSLMLKVAHEAIADSVWEPLRALKTGVLIGIGLDLNSTNYQLRWTMPERVRDWDEQLAFEATDAERGAWLEKLRDSAGPPLTANRTMGALGGLVASRVAREFHLGGPSFTISDDETSGNQAILVAVDCLRTGVLDAAIVGAIDFPSDPRIRAATAQLADNAQIPPCDGAGALVLKRLDDAIRDRDRIYAVIRDADAATCFDENSPALPPISAQPGAESLGQVEVLEAIDNPYRLDWLLDRSGLRSHDAPGCVIGGTQGLLGYAGAASGLVSILKAALSVYQQLLPRETPAGLRPAPERAFSVGPRFWAVNRDDGPRRAAVCAAGLAGSLTRIVLEEFPGERNPKSVNERSNPLGELDRAIFALGAADDAGLISQAESLGRLLEEHEGSIADLARHRRQVSSGRDEGRRNIAIVASGHESLQTQLREARDRLSGMAARSIRRPGQRDYLALPGPPLRESPGVAFIYPGLGNTYAEMGREISALWPDVMRRQERECERFRDQITRGTYWTEPVPKLFADHVDVIVGQVVVGCLATDIVRRHGIEPDAAIGYSMGETAAFVALRAWDDRDELLRRIQTSPLFRTELAGASNAARRFWSIPGNQTVDWTAGILVCSPDRVREMLRGNRSVFLLIVNSPQECVIGGRGEAVREFVRKLGSPFIEIPAVSTVHCPIGALVEREYRELHDLPTQMLDLPFYSGVWARPYHADRKTAAEAITAQAGNTIDFAAVIERAYRDGIRVFLEMGPGSSCTRMIGQILGERPHLARAACPSNVDPLGAMLGLFADLIAWNVPVDLSPFERVDQSAPSAMRTGKPIRQLQIQVGLQPFAAVKSPRPTRKPQPKSKPVLVENPVRFTPEINDLEPPKVRPAMPNRLETSTPEVDHDPLTHQLFQSQSAAASAHDAYLKVANDLIDQIGAQIARQFSLLERTEPLPQATWEAVQAQPRSSKTTTRPVSTEPVALDRDQCLEFAIGSIARVLGPEFAQIDSYPTRVRLPDEPLMLVDRIMTIEGTYRTLTQGRVVTEHDVLHDGWYLNADRIAPGVAIESGQADLFLAGYLGIDFETRGLAVYRLLDATVTFHRGLPRPGDVVRYDIRITEFFRQNETYLFRFGFEATVDGEPLMTMKDGCAGFFSPAELAAGKGIVPRPLDRRPRAGVRPDDWADLVPMAETRLHENQVEQLRNGNFRAAFGAPFDRLGLLDCLRLPGGLMKLVDRVEMLEPDGGRFGLGTIRTEADIHPDDWFIVCHFVDDRVMPGTLMYEGCLHTLRIFMMRLGWVGDAGKVAYEPAPGVGARLRCRGQVLETCRKVTYEVTIKELGYRPEPYAIADAMMYADGKPIVEIADLSLQLTGTTRGELESLWQKQNAERSEPEPPAIFNEEQFLQFAIGKPSLAFGEKLRAFDEDRFIARLPRTSS